LEKEVESWDDISEFMSSYTNSAYTTPIELTYVRGGETETITVRPYVILNSIELVGVFVENGIEIIKIEELNERIAMNVGLEENDIIVAVTDAEGKTYTGISGIYAALKNYRGSHKENALNMLTITVLRDSVETEIKVQPYSQKVMETAQRDAVDVMLGINPQYKFHFGKSILYSFQNTGHSFTSVFNSIKLLITEESVTLEAMSGPVGIFGITKETASYGFTNLLHLLGLLSVNVGLLNLFPIPALDGGRLVFLGYEAITKKKPSPKVETALISITMILLLGLMIIVTFNDVLKLFR
jgi:regulator of sigma E protease